MGSLFPLKTWISEEQPRTGVRLNEQFNWHLIGKKECDCELSFLLAFGLPCDITIATTHWPQHSLTFTLTSHSPSTITLFIDTQDGDDIGRRGEGG
jgi:hypothetical protein